MNRNERADRKRKKREQKQRSARQRTRAVASAGPEEQAVPSVMNIASEAALTLRSDLTSALRTKTANGVLHAAEIASDAVDRSLAKQWEDAVVKAACGECNYCCQGLRVDVTIPEVARVAEYTRKHLSAETLSKVTAKARTNAAETHGKSVLGYPVRLPCALLGGDGKCLAYEARPIACRKEHSLDADECRTGYEQQTLDSDYDIPRDPSQMFLGGALLIGYCQALEEAGLDGGVYELQEALHIALSDPDATTKWLAGEPVFEPARVNDDELPPPPPRLVPLHPKRP